MQLSRMQCLEWFLTINSCFRVWPSVHCRERTPLGFINVCIVMYQKQLQCSRKPCGFHRMLKKDHSRGCEVVDAGKLVSTLTCDGENHISSDPELFPLTGSWIWSRARGNFSPVLWNRSSPRSTDGLLPLLCITAQGSHT